MIQSTTLRPGLLVSLKTGLTGNVQYDKVILEPERTDENGTARARWETVKTITDKEEHDRAEKARSKAAGAVRGVCAQSAFGYLCPEADADRLEAAIAEARAIADAFNRTARLSRVSIYVITGRIAADDAEAVKAINSELADLMARMVEGVERIDVKTIRDAADRAVQVQRMLPVDVQARAQLAIDAARKAARDIVKAGEAAAQEIDKRAIRQITDARMTFLELDDNGQEIAPAGADASAIDLEPATVAADAGSIPQMALEF